MISRTLTKTVGSSLTAIALCIAQTSFAESYIEEVVVIGSKEDLSTLAGSGAVLDEIYLDKRDDTDLHRALAEVPGIYVREEDGYGLRPNIGIRGATTDRSQKITMMEDGVLIGPAPYSAPAAYYVPNVNRMGAIEILKGPAAIKYGPHTVGGAINFVTRDVPDAFVATANASLGSDGYEKYEGSVGNTVGSSGVLVDFLHYSSDGFKRLDSGGSTGFERNDVNIKIKFKPKSEMPQVITVKAGWADEDSSETYLGLTDDDFRKDPDRRYAASQLDGFVTEHRLLHVNYGVEVSNHLTFNAKAYYNEYERAWNKFDGFLSGTPAQRVLSNPGLYVAQYEILSGSRDSSGAESQAVDVTNNDREFKSFGLRGGAALAHQLGGFTQNFQLGLRFHYDEVEREHRQLGYLMQNGRLIFDGIARRNKITNKGETDAVSVFAANEVELGSAVVTLGVRYEDIDGSLNNFLAGTESSNKQQEWMPSISFFYELSDSLSLLGGVHKGLSPSGPGATDVAAEESINYEFGSRLQRDQFYVEAIAFFSDYSNLLGRCRVSDFGCQAGEEFSGGEVEIKGLEALVGFDHSLWPGAELDARLTYTFTDSEFKDSFLSTFSQFGIVEAGDELPYLPRHIASVSVSLDLKQYSGGVAFKHTSKMREEPGSSSVSSGIFAEAQSHFDLHVRRSFGESTYLQLMVRNLTDDREIVAHRPFGARPGLPRTVIFKVEHSVGG